MFTTLLPLFASVALLANVFDNDSLPAAVPAAPEATTSLEAAPIVSAQLYITYVGNGYYNVVISGQASAVNAAVGVRVYGSDTWFDDHLFSIIGYARTDFSGYFSVARQVHRSVLNEDWEGTDEIYAIADVSGAGSGRTNQISRSF